MMNPKRRYFVAGIIARRRRDGKLEFLVINTIHQGDKEYKIKFPGGMEESTDRGRKFRTLRREIKDETGLYIKSDVRPYRFSRIVTSEGHEKYWYFLWRSNCKGTIRTESIRDGDTWLGPPEWLTLQELLTSLHPSHRLVLKILKNIP